MKRYKQQLLILLLTVLIVLGVGVGLAVVYVHSIVPHIPAPTETTIIWKTSNTLFTKQDQQAIKTALKTALSTPDSGYTAGYAFTIVDVQRQGAWAIFSAVQSVNPTAAPIPSEPLFFIAHQQGTVWSVWLPTSRRFCDQLKQLPDTLLAPEDKDYFIGC